MSEIAVFLPFYFAWLWIGIFLHELAHFCVGRALGLKPYGLLVGNGPLLVGARIKGVKVELRLFPGYGFTFSPARPPDTPLWRDIAYFSAGLVTDGLMLGLLLFLFFNKHLSSLGPVFFIFMVAMHIGIMLRNLIPRDVNVGGVMIPNDGKLIWSYLRGGTAHRAQRYREFNARAVRRYDPSYNLANEPGHDWTEKAAPALVSLYYQAGAADETGNQELASEGYLAVLDAAGPLMSSAEQARLLDLIACNVLFARNAPHYPQALLWAERARQLLPDCATVRGTHGALLVETAAQIIAAGGEGAAARADELIEAGLQLLVPLTEEGQAQIDRVISTQFIINAHTVRGDARLAAEWQGKLKKENATPVPWAKQTVRPSIRVGAAFFAVCGVLACWFALRFNLQGGLDLIKLFTLFLMTYMTILFANIAVRGRAPAGWAPWR